MPEYACGAHVGLVSALDLPEELLDQLVGRAASVAIDVQDPVTLIGVLWGRTSWGLHSPAGVLCRSECRYRHPDSLVIIPGVLMMELLANGWDDEPTLVLTRGEEGESVCVYKVGADGTMITRP